MMKIWSENPQHKISDYIIFNMSASEVCFLVSVLLALAAQAVNLAAASLGIIFINDSANLSSSYDTFVVDANRAQFIFILAAASISALILIYFIIDYFTRWRTPKNLNIALLCIVVVLQIAIGIVWAAYLADRRDAYDYAVQNY